ncbi:YiiQ family protein [Edwardsiella tarda]|uniref:DUF1454 family protein n=1 Tax=Edwardsiella tarda TaxID=636 RepID=UPI0028525D08|nr:DUF1454 family protein [Edwardsiella tarda]UCQ26612.1 YiiQ family protein [Edwardsiella tarda]
MKLFDRFSRCSPMTYGIIKMLRAVILSIFLLTSFFATSNSASSDPTHELPKVAPYALPDSPTFNLTLVDFRSRHNENFPQLHLNEYHAVSIPDEQPFIVFTTSITEAIRSSAVLEKGTDKIKSLQITYFPEDDAEYELLDLLLDSESSIQQLVIHNITDIEVSSAKGMENFLAIRYMAAIIQSFSPTLSTQQSLEKIIQLLSNGKNLKYYSQPDGSLRYVVSDNRELGITFAIEPIKLTPSKGVGL